MRKSLTILFLSFSLIASATNYYVATPASGGNDANPGTFAQPWASWEEAFSSTSVNPGDTVFIRGGVYFATVIDGTGIRLTRSGTSGSWIVYTNYPGEKPIMDFSNQTAGDILNTGSRNDGIHTNGVFYVKLVGLTVRNVKQFYNRNYARAIYLRNGIVTLERCVSYNNWGHGVHTEHNTDDGGNTHYIINCDSYNNCDSISGSPLGSNGGATGAGFDSWFGITSGKTYFINCRAWNNSDQGYSIPCEGYVKCEGCWSFANNAYVSGGGAGFKMGWQNIDVPDLRREMINCVAAFNDGMGFFTNEKGSGDAPDWNAVRSNHFNNIAYHNGYVQTSDGFGFMIQDTEQADTIEQWRNFSNNINYDNYRSYVYTAGGAAEYSGSNNSWDIPLTLTDADFVSLDTTGITAPRQADGSLPDNDCYNKFLKLANNSQAINRGIDVGLTYTGAAPDLGPFEWNDYDAPPPLISTMYPSVITSKKIVTGGYIIEDYDESIVWKGVCWNTTGNPSDEDDRISGGTGSDPYTVTISGLTANTTYYIRAYAITESGTGYGNTYEITTDKRTQLTLNGKPVVRGGVIQTIGLAVDTPPPPEVEDSLYYLILPPNATGEGIPLVSRDTTIIYGNTLANIPLDTVFTYEYTCDIGETTGDNFLVYPTDGDVGEHDFTVTIKKDGATVATQTTNLIVYEKHNADSVSILAFGDSNMSNRWDYEMSGLKSVFDTTIFNSIGIYNTNTAPYYHNAISGYHYYRYMNSSLSPLVKDGVFNVPAFFVDNSLATPDFVYVRLGTNDINNQTASGMTEAELATILTYMEIFVDAFLAYDANIKVIIGLPSYCGSSKALWDADYDGTASEDRQDVFVENAHRFYEQLIENYANPKYNSRVHLCYAPFQLDRSEYDDAIHTTRDGAYQMGLGLANVFSKLHQP